MSRYRRRHDRTTVALLAMGACLALDSAAAAPRLERRSTTPLAYPDFVEPVAVAAGPLAQIYVADLGRNAVVRLDTLLHLAYEFELPEDQRSMQPIDVEVTGFQVYVLDADANALLRFTSDGAYLDVLQSFRAEGIETPRAVSVDGTGRVLLVNQAQHRARIVDERLQTETAVGGFGTRHGELSHPAGGAFAPNGSFFVSDTGNGRVQHYSRVGNLEPTHFAGIVEPRGMVVGSGGALWVADSAALHWYHPTSFAHAQLDLPDLTPIDVCAIGDEVLVLSVDPPALVRVRVIRAE